MSNQLGLALMFGPPVVIVALVVAFRVFGPRRSVPGTASPAPADMTQARLDVARSVAAGLLAEHDALDDATLAEVMVLKDQRRPTHAVKFLRERALLGLGDARRLVDRLP